MIDQRAFLLHSAHPMDRFEQSETSLQNEESIGRRAFMSGVTIAAITSAMTLLVRNVLPAAGDNRADVFQLRRETNRSWISSQDAMFEGRQKPLEVGDEGLIIHEQQQEIEFAYDFSLHPLKEFPGINHIERFRQFIESWMRDRGMNDHWIVCPVDVRQGIEPDERCIVPLSMYWYHLKCTVMPKPIGHRLGLMA